MLPPGSAYRVADAGDVPGSAEDGAGNAAAHRGGGRPAARRRGRAAAAGRRRLGADPLPARLRRPRADHRGPGRCPPGLPRRAGRRARRLLVAMRRASEMAHVERIVQVGLRGVGSARPSDVADARAAGNLLVTARELDERGVPWLLEQLPADASVVVAFDLDGLDPSVAPAVSGTAPGGLIYAQAAGLLLGLTARSRVAGAVFTEMVPALDVNDLTALVAVRLLSVLIGGLARRGMRFLTRSGMNRSILWTDASLPPGHPAAVAADARPHDRRRAGARARGLRADRPPRRRGAERGRRAGLCRARSARRRAAGRGLPHPADGHDRRRGGGPVPVRPARPRRRARPGHGHDRRPAEGDGRPARGAARPRLATGGALLP